MNIILCGLPKSGKTTLGKLLAERLNWPFIDTDRLIENRYASQTNIKSSCREIYLHEGEKFFRALEKEAILSLERIKHTVIATGGGSLCDIDNIKVLESIGILIYLKTSLEVIWDRLKNKELPSYLHTTDPKASFYTLAESRIPLYEKWATFHIDTHLLTKDRILTTILEKLQYGK